MPLTGRRGIRTQGRGLRSVLSEPQLEDGTKGNTSSSPLVRFRQDAGKVRAKELMKAEGGCGALRRGRLGLPKGS